MKIKFENITVKAGKKIILDNLSMEAQPQKITGIIGPNGSGKSTLIKTVFEIVKKSSGNIYLEGKNLDKMSKMEVSNLVGYVSQEMSCVFDFSVKEVVAMGLYGKRHSEPADQVVERALQDLKILHLKDRSILTLSGGERKLMFLARTIAQNVDAIILDEPTNHLDIKHQLFILNYLKKTEKTVIIVLHDIRLAAHYCDNIYLINAGRNICSGSPGKVLTKKNIQEIFEVRGEAAVTDDGEYDFRLEMSD